MHRYSSDLAPVTPGRTVGQLSHSGRRTQVVPFARLGTIVNDSGFDMNSECPSSLDLQWKRVSGLLRAEIGEAAYRSWLKPMVVRGAHSGLVTMTVPTRFMRDWVVAHYSDRLRALWGGENP